MNKLNLILLCLIGWQIGQAQNVGIGTTNPAASAQLEVSSTNKGFLMPRMTTAQRNSIVSPAVGLQIFNLDDQCTDLYDGTNWIKTCGLKVTGPATDPYHPTPDSWVQKASFGPGARHNAVGFSIGSKGYIGTGFDGSNKKDFWEYDPASNAWIQKADFGGSARSNAVGFSIGSKGYIGTGFDGSSKNDFWEYDPASNIWIQKADFGGSARSSAVGFNIGSKGYLGTGGGSGGATFDFWEYDPASDSWTKKADFGGLARQASVGFSIGNKGYLGTGISAGGSTKDFWEYDPATNGWTKKADFGGLTNSRAVGFSIGSLGYLGTGSNGTMFKDFWEYNPSNDQWTKKADFGGSPRFSAVGFSIGRRGFIGTGNTAGIFQTDFWEYLDNNVTGVAYSTVTGLATDNIITDGAWSLYNGTVFNANAGNVGIGTSTPAQKLDVAGGIKASTTLTAGGLTTPGIVTNTAAGLLGTTSVIPVANGGTGASSLTGYIKGNGTGAMTAQSGLPATDLTGLVPVANGGTGAGSLTGYIKGNGTGAMTAQSGLPATDLTGLVPVANGGTGAGSLTGYIKGNGTGAMTAQSGLPATDLTGIVPVANGGTGTATAFTAGSLVFAGASGLYSQNNAQLFWNNTNQRLGIGTLSPTNKLSVSGTGGILSSTTNPGSGTADWIAGNFGGTAGDRVVMGNISSVATIGAHNNALNTWSNLSINPGPGNVGIGTLTAVNKLDVEGGIAIGSGYAGTYAAPSNGAIIQGNVVIGNSVSETSATLEVYGTTKIGKSGTTLSGIVKRTYGLPAGNFAANSSSSFTFAFAGATTGGSVMVSPSSALPAGMVIAYGWVSGNGNVDVVLRNTTGATINYAGGINLFITIVTDL